LVFDDLLDAWSLLEVEQPGDPEADLRLAVAVGVVAFDVEGGTVAHRAFDHCRDLGGGAADQLGVDRHRLGLDVPVDQDAGLAVASVSFAEEV